MVTCMDNLTDMNKDKFAMLKAAMAQATATAMDQDTSSASSFVHFNFGS